MTEETKKKIEEAAVSFGDRNTEYGSESGFSIAALGGFYVWKRFPYVPCSHYQVQLRCKICDKWLV